ncbi:hypothetical protein D3C76_1287380 [compost metagenome]
MNLPLASCCLSISRYPALSSSLRPVLVAVSPVSFWFARCVMLSHLKLGGRDHRYEINPTAFQLSRLSRIIWLGSIVKLLVTFLSKITVSDIAIYPWSMTFAMSAVRKYTLRPSFTRQGSIFRDRSLSPPRLIRRPSLLLWRISANCSIESKVAPAYRASNVSSVVILIARS